GSQTSSGTWPNPPCDGVKKSYKTSCSCLLVIIVWYNLHPYVEALTLERLPQYIVKGFVLQVEVFGDRLIGHVSIHHIYPACQGWVVFHRFLQPFSDFQGIRNSYIGKSIGGSACNRSRDIGHSIMNHSVLDVGRIAVSRHMITRLDRPSLVDGY